MKKGMSATELIVALAVGLIVIIGLGYLVWTWLGKGGGKVSESYCNGQLLAYCTQWSASNYEGPEPKGGFSEFAPDCRIYNLGSRKEDCQRLLNPLYTETTT
ncbi:MAG: hypothetical protein QXY45_00225 [Candidatus Aenigmatarchaeota archaeon]